MSWASRTLTQARLCGSLMPTNAQLADADRRLETAESYCRTEVRTGTGIRIIRYDRDGKVVTHER